MMPDCSFEELIPIFSTRYSGDHLWLRPAMKRCGISRLGSQITPGEFTTHDTASSQSSQLQSSIKSFIYVLQNLREPVRCSPKRNSMWQITQTPIFIQQRWRAACFVRLGSGIPIRGQLFCFMRPEINFGFTSEFSRTHASVTCLR